MKELIILGGPNGAGKTTAARGILPGLLRIREFVNADEIARGLSPFNPDGAALAAGRAMIERIRSLVRAGESLAIETTCSGHGHIRLIRDCRALGYRTTLIFLWLPSPEAAIARVARRVSEGGHRIPDDVVERRYWTGLRNLRHAYLSAVDAGLVYDNSDQASIVVAESLPGEALVVRDRESWAQIEKATT